MAQKSRAGGDGEQQSIDFFFDLISPFSYLAHGQVADLAERYGYRMRYRPLDIPRIKLAAGNTGPSNREIPPKFRYLMKDLERWANRLSLPLGFPKAFRSPRMNTGTFFAEALGQTRQYVEAGFQRVWGVGGVDPDADSVLSELAQQLGWGPQEFLAYVNSAEGRKEYEASMEEAERRGVFGAPIMLIREEMWWGNDRMEFLEEYLAANPGR